MNIDTWIKTCRQTGKTTFDEARSKQIIAQYDIPVVTEIIAADTFQAAAAAEKTGYPLVLKGLGSGLAHKTEQGLVRVNLQSEQEMQTAFSQIRAAAGKEWEGCLLQPMVSGRREFVAGLV